MIKQILQNLSSLFETNINSSRTQDNASAAHSPKPDRRLQQKPKPKQRSFSTQREPHELLRQGRLQIAVSGFHETAFDISLLARHDSPNTRIAVDNLPCKVKIAQKRNVADALDAALSTLDGVVGGRRAILLISSGNPTCEIDHLSDLADEATRRSVAIHVIYVGNEPERVGGLAKLSTAARLGYGGFHAVMSDEKLIAAIHKSFSGMLPKPAMRGVNRAAVMVDCSERMVEAFGDTTRIDMVIKAIQHFLQNPLGGQCSSNGRPERENSKFIPPSTVTTCTEWRPGDGFAQAA